MPTDTGWIFVPSKLHAKMRSPMLEVGPGGRRLGHGNESVMNGLVPSLWWWVSSHFISSLKSWLFNRAWHLFLFLAPPLTYDMPALRLLLPGVKLSEATPEAKQTLVPCLDSLQHHEPIKLLFLINHPVQVFLYSNVNGLTHVLIQKTGRSTIRSQQCARREGMAAPTRSQKLISKLTTHHSPLILMNTL